MNKCRNCNVLVEENLNKCPLCQSTINYIKVSGESNLYPAYDLTKAFSKRNFIFRFVLFFSIAVISSCLLINLLTDTKNLWFLYVTGSVLYILLSVNHTILSKAPLGTKILFQVMGLSSMLFLIDLISGYYRWSVNIVFPILVITTTSLITLVIFIKRKLWDDYIWYVIVFSFLGFAPILLYSFGVSNSIWASAVSAFYGFSTIVGLLLLPGINFKNEFVRRFHF